MLLEVSTQCYGKLSAFLLLHFGLSDQQDCAGMVYGWVGVGKLIFGYILVAILWEVGALSQQVYGKLWHNKVKFDFFSVFLLHGSLIALADGE